MTETDERCLYCRAPLSLPIETSNSCPECVKINLREDLRIYRTRRVFPRAIEWFLKASIVAAIGALTWSMVVATARSREHIFIGYMIGLPALLALARVLWDSIGRITRRESVLSMGVFWPMFVVSLIAGPLYISLAIGSGVRDTPDVVLFAAGCLAASIVVRCGWRVWRIASPRRG